MDDGNLKKSGRTTINFSFCSACAPLVKAELANYNILHRFYKSTTCNIMGEGGAHTGSRMISYMVYNVLIFDECNIIRKFQVSNSSRKQILIELNKL